MKGFLIFLLVAAIGVGGFGLYRGWWSFSPERGRDGKVNLGLEVDKDKIAEDKAKARDKAQDRVDGAKEKARDKVLDKAEDRIDQAR